MTHASSSPGSPGSGLTTPRHGTAVAPSSAQPTPAKPGVVEPGVVEPGVVEPGVFEPGVVEPGAVEPELVEPAVVDGVDVDAVARAVRACAGVSDLHAGRFGEVGSYLPGRRVPGVQVDDGSITVQVRTRWGHSPGDVFAQVDGVTAALRHGRALNVVVADIDDDPSLPGVSRSQPGPSATGASRALTTPAITPPATTQAAPLPGTVVPLPESSIS